MSSPGIGPWHQCTQGTRPPDRCSYGLYFTIYLGSGAISPSLYGLVGDAWGLQSVFIAMALASLAIVHLAGLYYRSRSRLSQV